MPVCSEDIDELGQGYRTEIDLGSDMNRWRTLYASSANFYNNFDANDCVTQILPGAINMKNSSDNLENIYNRITYSGINFFDWPDSTYYYRGILNPYSVFLKDKVGKSFLTAGGLSSPRTFAYNHSLYFDREDMIKIREIEAEGLPGTVVSEGDESISTHEYEEPIVTKKDLLNFILNEVKIHEYMPKPLDAIHDDVNLSYAGVYLGLLSDDYIDHSDADNCVWNSLVGTKIFRNIVSDVNDDGIITDNEGHEKHTYSLNALVCALIGAFQQYALTQVMNYATVDYVKKSVDNVDAWTNALQVVSEGDEGIEPLAGTADKINGGYIMDGTLKGSQVSKSGSNNILITSDIVDSVTSTSTNKPASAAAVKKAYDKAVQALNNSGNGEECRFNDFFIYDDTAYYGANSLMLNEQLVVTSLLIDGDENNGLIVMGDSRVEMSNIYGVSSITFADGTELTTAGSSGNSNGGLSSDALEVINGKLHIKLPVNFEDSANFSYCGIINGKSNLTGITELDAMTIYCANINPVYDGSGVVKIHGDLEVTGNLITSSHATANIDLLDEQQETINALQNTVQQQQETIAALEARLARIEQYLDLGDDI